MSKLLLTFNNIYPYNNKAINDKTRNGYRLNKTTGGLPRLKHSATVEMK